MKTKHTPTPWKCNLGNGTNLGNDITLWGADGQTTVALIDSGNNNWSETDAANAAFIVTACNHHHELVSALEVFQQLSNNLSVSLTPDQIAAATAAIASHSTQVHFLIAKVKGTP